MIRLPEIIRRGWVKSFPPYWTERALFRCCSEKADAYTADDLVLAEQWINGELDEAEKRARKTNLRQGAEFHSWRERSLSAHPEWESWPIFRVRTPEDIELWRQGQLEKIGKARAELAEWLMIARQQILEESHD